MRTTQRYLAREAVFKTLRNHPGLLVRDDYSEQHHYGHKISFYKFFAADSSRLEGTGSDTMYQHAYKQINISNIGRYQKVIQNTSGKQYLEARALLETIEDTNYYESQLKTVLSIYLDRIINDSVINAQDTAILTEIAYQNYLIGGEAVYLARAILRLEIEDGPFGEARLKKQEALREPRYFRVFPNPASESLNLDFNQEELVDRIDITDLSGRLSQTIENIKMVVASDLKPGLYFISLQYKDGTIITRKFIKIKNND